MAPLPTPRVLYVLWPEPLIVPGRYNFPQGAIYRIKLTDIPGRAGVELYPTLEIGPPTPRTEAYLAHNAIPAQFTEEDFDQVLSGNFVTKVIYLPDPEFQELALAGVETLVSTRLDPGVDPIGMIRATWLRITEGRWRQGGSTITQQLARNIFLTNERTFARKLREAILAFALEWRFSKDQILELYLNRVYFGGGAYGIDAASRRFFGHSATQLSIPEAAIVAGLVKAPSSYSPTADAEAARGRAAVALDLMVRSGAISPAQAAAAHPEDVQRVVGRLGL